METSHWRKWFHTHKISLILCHDTPLPSTLYTANSAQRYPVGLISCEFNYYSCGQGDLYLVPKFWYGLTSRGTYLAI